MKSKTNSGPQIKNQLKVQFLIFLLLGLISACSSKPILPDAKSVKVSRDNPAKDCVEIGRVVGTTQSVSATSQDALDDMQREADKKGANYLRVDQYSDTGRTVTGTAFKCP